MLNPVSDFISKYGAVVIKAVKYVIILFIGIALLIGAFKLNKISSKYSKHNNDAITSDMTGEVKGEVSKIIHHSKQVEISYTVSGKTYSIIPDYEITGSEVGEEVDVRYNPGNPAKAVAVIDESILMIFKVIKIAYIALYAIGGVITLLSLIALIKHIKANMATTAEQMYD